MRYRAKDYKQFQVLSAIASCRTQHKGYIAPMFSYRHAFHAGNHADVLKHTILIAVLRHLMQKEASIQYVDTHAGAGLYRLDGDYAEKSGEAAEGVLKLKIGRAHV